MLRSDGLYKGPPIFTKIIPLNADFKTPLPEIDGALATLTANGGVGPWDFSGASDPTAVPLIVKIGSATAIPVTISVDTGAGAVDGTAVTAAELATAIGTLVARTTWSETTGRIVGTVITPGTNQYLQVYGEAAEIAEFGQGYGLQFRYMDTQQSIAISQTNVELSLIHI